jgi:hypothetical protein
MLLFLIKLFLIIGIISNILDITLLTTIALTKDFKYKDIINSVKYGKMETKIKNN